jgi:hypothetical protein
VQADRARRAYHLLSMHLQMNAATRLCLGD